VRQKLARRWKPSGWGRFSPFLRRSSLLELRKTGSQRHPRES
jgi:hypothetical protein